MTAPDPRVGEIQARAVEAALSAYYERGGLTFASAHPDTRSIELEDMRAALEAAAPHMHAYLLAELADRDEKLAKVAELHTEDLFRGHLSNGCKTCGNGEHGYPCPTAAAVAAANGGDRG